MPKKDNVKEVEESKSGKRKVDVDYIALKTKKLQTGSPDVSPSRSPKAIKMFSKGVEATWDDFDDEEDSKPVVVAPPAKKIGIQQSTLGIFKGEEETETAFKFGSLGSTSFASFASNKGGFGSFGAPGPGPALKSSFSDLLAVDAKTKDHESDYSDGDEEDDDEEPARKSPVLSPTKHALPNATILTGEEDESTVYTTRCKLFTWLDDNWKERGIGTLKLNINDAEPPSYRLVMRTDHVFRLILNVKILKSLPRKLRDEKYVEVAACETAPELTKFLFKFGNGENAQNFAETLDRYLE